MLAVPRQGRRRLRQEHPRHEARGRQQVRRLLHLLPRHAQHLPAEGPALAGLPAEPAGDLREVPRQPGHDQEGQHRRAGRGHGAGRREGPLQPLQAERPRPGGAQVRARRLGGLQRLPRHARHPAAHRPEVEDQPRQHPHDLRRLPQRRARAVQRERPRPGAHQRQEAPQRQERADLHGLPPLAQHRPDHRRRLEAAQPRAVRHLPRRPAGHLPRDLPRAGHGARLREGRPLQRLPRLAQHPAGQGPEVDARGRARTRSRPARSATRPPTRTSRSTTPTATTRTARSTRSSSTSSTG